MSFRITLWLLAVITAAGLALCLSAGSLHAAKSKGKSGNDIDRDGILNAVDPDVDGDGLPNGSDPNVDGGTVLSGPLAGKFVGDEDPNDSPKEKDIDGDGEKDDSKKELDIDGDGLKDDDLNEDDIDGDGLKDDDPGEDDIDGDGRKNSDDDDRDGDHLDDEDDFDDDGDGIDDDFDFEGTVIVLKPGESHEQLWLADAAPNTHFDGRGVILYGGDSPEFRPPPQFCLFSDPRRDPANGIGYESMAELESRELPNEECYPLQVRDMESPSISGISVIGLQSRDLPWRVMKSMWDGDAVVVRHCRGRAVLSSAYLENTEDGFGPQIHLESWSLRDTYMRYIRDDAVENDYLIPGEIENCLIDGCFVFLSHRPDEEANSKVVTTIRNCVVHVEAQPHDGFEGREWRNEYIQIGADGIGRSPGMLFKWTEGGGSVLVEDCVFRVDAMSASGPSDMTFPPGVYRNVTLVWLGPGAYPAPLPRGVTLSRDLRDWEMARARWIAGIPDDHPAATLLRSTPP